MSGTEQPPKLLFVNHWAAHPGGAELSLLDILSEAVKRSDVYLITAESGFLVDKAQALGVRCTVLPCSQQIARVRRNNLLTTVLANFRPLFSFLLYCIRIRKCISEIRPDLIHANVPKSHVAVSLAIRFLYQGVCCFHIREIFPGNSLARYVYRVLLPKNALIIAISHAVKAALHPAVQSNALVIHNGIVIPPSCEKKSISNPLRFLYLGRIVPWKGCHLLLGIFDQLHRHYGLKTPTLTLAGGTYHWDQSYRRELESLICKLGLQHVCNLLPHTETPQEHFRTHDVFLSASGNEPFGRVIAEAQAFGLPVIGFDSGGVSEIVMQRQTGILVSCGDMSAMKSAICTIIENPQLCIAFGDAARQRTAQLFNRDIQIPSIVDLLYNHVKGKSLLNDLVLPEVLGVTRV